MELLKIILFPFAVMYGIAVRIRNWLFDTGILKEKEFRIPIIGVGNLSLGGTGKTPFVEYLVKFLADDYRVAILSRGYGRSTSLHLEAYKPFLHISLFPPKSHFFWCFHTK